MSLTLNDGLSHYRSVSDATHRFWGYFQAVAGATAAFAWSRKAPDAQLFAFLSLGFCLFAIFNQRLVVESQAEAVATATSVKKFAITLESKSPSDLLPLVQRIGPEPADRVRLWHAGLSLATLAAVWWRYFSF